jgi:8-oxo-dGTP pyrophosphatase MutT (NUDIX family)
VGPGEIADAPEVRGAGGVLVREMRDGAVEVAVVHRPKYDDWSLPKGKLEAGESFEAAAVREVEEETGWRATIEGRLRDVRYRDRRGRSKLVRYFLMRSLDGEFRPGSEVDELAWLRPTDAVARLSYEDDRVLVASLEQASS